jgi:4-carboxymuconolactone decarboxylase
MDERKRYEQGMKTRRAILGDARVDRTLKNRTRSMNRFRIDYPLRLGGDLSRRPAKNAQFADPHTVALNREPNSVHLKAALSIGVTRDEIQEVLLQAAVYCGVPAAKSAFHAAEEVFGHLNSKKTK